MERVIIGDLFTTGEVKSSYGYTRYERPQKLSQQYEELVRLFPGLDSENPICAEIEHGRIPLPQYAEGWFAIPNWQKRPDLFGVTYPLACQCLLTALSQVCGRSLHSQLPPANENHLRPVSDTDRVWSDLRTKQGDPDILIIAAQFGRRHRGRSAIRAGAVIDATPGEFRLGVLAVGSMLALHPDRLQAYEDLWIDITGDETCFKRDGRFGAVPFFGLSTEKAAEPPLTLEIGHNDCASEYSGAASGFTF